MPEWLESKLTLIKLVGGAVAGFAAMLAGWASLGGPVPASRDWVTEYHADLAERDEARLSLAATLSPTLLHVGRGIC